MACLRQLAQREAAEVCEYAMSLAKNAGDKESSGASKLFYKPVFSSFRYFNISNDSYSITLFCVLKYGQFSYSLKKNHNRLKNSRVFFVILHFHL